MLSTLEALRPKKRLFLGLLLASEFFVALTLYGAWRISYLGLENIFKYLPAIVGAFLIFISTFSFGAVCNMVLAIKGLRFVGLDLPIVVQEIAPIIRSLANHSEHIIFAEILPWL